MVGRTTAHGYGKAHRQQRQAWAPIVAAGYATCWRCGQPIQPGTPWDLGHTDDRTTWAGPEHRNCNRAAGWAKLTRLRQLKRRPPHPTPPTW